jgi:methionyl aminopeptidase
MYRAGQIVAETLARVAEEITPGVRTRDLDWLAEERIRKTGATPAFKGYQGFPYTLCVSINEQVVHGFPSERRLEEGDLVSIDCGAIVDGYYSDAAETYRVGTVSVAAAALMETTEECLRRAIEQMRVGNRLQDIGYTVQTLAESKGYSVVKDFVGHGIGRALHEEPQVPNWGKPNRGLRLKPGMVLAVEPMVNAGGEAVRVLEDNWTAVTCDNSLSAHYEHSIAITDNGPRVLTRLAA